MLWIPGLHWQARILSFVALLLMVDWLPGDFYKGMSQFVIIIIFAAPLMAIQFYVEARLTLEWRRWLTNRLLMAYYSDQTFFRKSSQERFSQGNLTSCALHLLLLRLHRLLPKLLDVHLSSVALCTCRTCCNVCCSNG